MRRYLLSFLGAFAVSEAVLWGMTALGFYLWFWDEPPLWFETLWLIAVLLPFPALGEFFGRRPGAAAVRKDWRGLWILSGVMMALSILNAAGIHIPNFASPGELLGGFIKNAVGLRRWYRWKGIVLNHAFAFLGNLLIPPLFHLGWRWGRTANE